MLVGGKKLLAMQSLPALDGTVMTMSASGMLTWQNLLVLTFPLLVGPMSILLAATLAGSLKERIFTAIIASSIATLLVLMATILGGTLTNIINTSLLTRIGGVAVLSMGLMMAGVTIPEKTPRVIMAIGIIASIVWK